MRSKKSERITLDDCWNRTGIWGDKKCPELTRTPHCRNCEVYSQASRQLLDRKPPAGYLQSWTRLLAKPKESIVSGKISVLVFRLGPEWFALATSLFNEAAETKDVHSIPHRTNRTLLGIVNVRGEIHLCISMASLLGMDEQAEAETGKHMLIATIKDQPVAFKTAEVSGIRHYHPDELQKVPSTLSKEASACSKGLLRWKQQHIAVLDEQILSEKLIRSLQ